MGAEIRDHHLVIDMGYSGYDEALSYIGSLLSLIESLDPKSDVPIADISNVCLLITHLMPPVDAVLPFGKPKE